MSIVHTSTFTQSPIGTIPKSYPRHAELCRAAFIRYDDIRTPERSYRNWRIVADEKAAVNSRGVDMGRGSTKHRKFAMLLDYLAHSKPDFSREQLLDAALDLKTPNAAALMRQRWQDMHNDLAKLSVRGYETLQARPKKTASVDIEF